jgi:hypothetical protein
MVLEKHSVDTLKVILMPTKPVDFTERNVRRALRASVKEGFVVSGYEIMRDGTIRVLTVPPGTKSHDSELDKWLGKHPDAGQAQGHQ